MSYGIILRGSGSAGFTEEEKGLCSMFLRKGEEVGNPDLEYTMSKIQKAVGEDGMSRRQSIQHST